VGELLEVLIEVLGSVDLALQVIDRIKQLGQGSVPLEFSRNGGCHEYNIDSMDDLDEGQPYIWNRSNADYPS
jgi:hypothetical protein